MTGWFKKRLLDNKPFTERQVLACKDLMYQGDTSHTVKTATGNSKFLRFLFDKPAFICYLK
jgi:hypothetical protein